MMIPGTVIPCTMSIITRLGKNVKWRMMAICRGDGATVPPLPRLRGAGALCPSGLRTDLTTYPPAHQTPARRPSASAQGQARCTARASGRQATSVADGWHTETALHATDTFSAVIRCSAVKWLGDKNARSWDNTALCFEWLAHALFSKNNQKNDR